MTGVNSTEIVGVLKENIDLLEVSFKSVLAELRTQNDQYAWTLREIIIAFEGAIREFPTSNLTITQKTWLTSVQKFSERFGLFGAEYIENYLKINQFKPSPVVQQSMFNYGINIRQVNDQVRATLSGFVEAVYSFDIRFKASIKERYASIEKAIEDLVNYTHKIINGLDICIDSTEIRNCVAFLV